MNLLSLELAGRCYRADADTALDISIPLRFDEPQLQAFGAPSAQSEIYRVGTFTGDVQLGGSCNCRRYHLTPHCNGTHTESVGHITGDAVPINVLALSGLMLAQLITLNPIATDNLEHATNRVITQRCLAKHFSPATSPDIVALIVRTLPNTDGKPTRNYDAGSGPAYFEPAALAWLAEQGIEHLLVDLPSVDRMDDGGHLLAHRAFWQLPADDTQSTHAQRPSATITELIFVPNRIIDGTYLLNLQLAPFVSDATPSRPLLFPLLKS